MVHEFYFMLNHMHVTYKDVFDRIGREGEDERRKGREVEWKRTK